MVIDKATAGRFISEYKKFLLAIYQPSPGGPEPRRVIEALAEARKRFITNRGLLDEYLNDLEDGVLGLNDEIREITGGPSVYLESGVVVLDNQYVCDGLIATAAYLGRNMRNSWNELYKDLKQSGKFHVKPPLSTKR